MICEAFGVTGLQVYDVDSPGSFMHDAFSVT